MTAHNFSNVIVQTHAIAGQLEQLSEAVIKPVIRRKLHASLDPADTSARNLDALELVSAVQILLLAESDRSPGHESTILDLDSFAARVTANACYQYFRAKFPVRTQVENKIRYLIKHEPRYALWRGRDGRWVAGFSELQDNRSPGALDLAGAADHPLTSSGLSERELWIAIVDSAVKLGNGAVTLAQLISFAMVARNLHEAWEVVSADPEVDVLDGIPDPRVRADHSLEIRSRLRHLWRSMIRLSVADRTVLLLNLKDAAGDSLLPVFVLSGVARVNEIARSLDQSPEQLAEVWNSLPWDDNTIARHTQQTRQQVINGRYAARRRLAAIMNQK